MRPATTKCAHCGVEFPVTNATGPVPKFCKPSHRQMAFQRRLREDGWRWREKYGSK